MRFVKNIHHKLKTPDIASHPIGLYSDERGRCLWGGKEREREQLETAGSREQTAGTWEPAFTPGGGYWKHRAVRIGGY